jgi:hypothetical protein
MPSWEVRLLAALSATIGFSVHVVIPAAFTTARADLPTEQVSEAPAEEAARGTVATLHPGPYFVEDGSRKPEPCSSTRVLPPAEPVAGTRPVIVGAAIF